MRVNELLGSINENYFRKHNGECTSNLPEIQAMIAGMFGARIDPINYFTSAEEMPKLPGVTYVSEAFFALRDEIYQVMGIQPGITK